MSLALARKYRPATFDDLIGQEAVSQTLSLALDGDRLSHAYLFSGLRGSGKTSTARIFAKALLCEKGTTSQPCGTCTHCTMASSNSHMDIIEMDAASNRGIDDIKDLIEHTKYKPSSARFKIFIIDEVHMLTNQAFNALLKTLEEPPDFVKFILATTDPLKLPATILSRTQHFRFKKIPQNLVRGHLEHILNLENIGFEKDALEILARSGAGSLRDSLTLTDQAIVYSKNFVDINTVTQMLGIIEPSHLENLLNDIMLKDTQKILAFIHMATDYEAEMILDELTLYLKELLLSHSTKFSPMIIERFFRVIADSKSLLALGSDGEFVLSLSLFKMVESLETKEIDTMIRSLENELKGVEITTQVVSQPTPARPSPPEESKIVENTKGEIQKETPQKTVEPIIQKDEAEELFVLPSDETSTEIKPLDIMEKASSTETSTTQTNEVSIEDSQPPVGGSIEPTYEPIEDNNITVETPTTNAHQSTFNLLIEKIYDRSFDVGEVFKNNILFISFIENKLTWESTAEGDDKKSLIAHWGVINMFVKETFGLETKIVNIPKKKVVNTAENSTPTTSTSSVSDTPQSRNYTQNTVAEPVEAQIPHNDADTSSMIEDIEMKSSCIAPDAGETEAAKEKDPSTLLQEPMVKEAIALFDPKKVRIKRNS
ncbi:MAG: DNA polymerase III subunits gamma and tau (EC [uncultured Sulfurovum sp.]|uniref:DNA polymerase III subunit gamma/tau n=1 Tax=uncultured Sulfurovum sp. TaxID=269237 RepID=A0A6S6T6S7_9BACT|nr:MAG: DNA polymerase III subunits gamma and tau (EC [uncultured Sulfurovum sp.]